MQSLSEAARSFGITLTSEQLQSFEDYHRSLVDWNQRVNLTAITDREQVILKHFLDSLSVVPVLGPDPAGSLVDIGSGAGFPGLVLKIALPSLRVTLAEATRKKVEFLQHMIATLSLTGIEAMQARAEDLARQPEHRERYDYAVARAVADLAILVEYAVPFLRVGGVFIAQKGIAVASEIDGAGRALDLLGARVRETIPVHLPGLDPRHLIVVEKLHRTQAAYPRRAGIPERKPLR